MGESFSAQLSTGIATFSVPFALPPARGAAQPSLGLAYSSGSGHGVAGMGWDLGVPSISRQIDRGLPHFDDQKNWHPNQDRFVFNGGQELVPLCTVGPDLGCSAALTSLDLPDTSSESTLGQVTNDGRPGFGPEALPSWASGWQYFRPRVEGSFLRFFWSPDHRTWRVQDKSGVVMELGVALDELSAVDGLETHPSDKAKIFRWNLVRQFDQEGSEGARPNRVVYRYLHDAGMAYLTDVFTTSPVAQATTLDTSTFAHHVRLSYENRTDPTVSWRRGWETRSQLRLVRVDVASKPYRPRTEDGAFDSGADPVKASRGLVRRYHLAYEATSHVSLLASVQVEGRCSDTSQSNPIAENEAGQLPESTSCPRLPAMQFGYQHVTPYNVDGSPGKVDLPGYEGFDERLVPMVGSPNHSVDEGETDLFDINGDALPDVLATAGGLYKGNHGLFLNGGSNKAGAFWPACNVPVQGVNGDDVSVLTLSNTNVAALDLDGDGVAKLLHMPKQKDYAVYAPVRQGTCGSQPGWMWKGRHVTTASGLPPQLNFSTDAPVSRVLDVNGDGLVDLVRLTGTRMETYFSLGRYPNGDGRFGRASWTSATSANLASDPVTSCVPWSGGPLSFTDGDVRLADMNGDGLADLVRVRKGDIRYWPGRGNGFWGTGALDDCKEGTFGPERSVVMATSPQYSTLDGTGLRLDDVNGDGLDDLVQVRFDAVDVWLNVDGTGWTKDRHVIDGAPTNPELINRVRLVDVNGSGTRDVLWGDGLNYRYMDLLGGTRPWVLTKVANGLGKTTELTYASSVEQMLAAAKAGNPWSSTAPMPLHVVVRSTEKDNLSIAGRPAGVYITEYTYRDPVYDGQQREFRGFRQATARMLGDDNSPTSLTTSQFLLGECKDSDAKDGVDACAVSERWRDNPREALKGLPVVAEASDEKGTYLSTTHHTYRLRQLHRGLDGRAVVHAFEAQTDTFLYDAVDFVAVKPPKPLAMPEVEVQLADTSHPAGGGTASTETGAVLVRAAKGTVHLHSAGYVDVFGNRFAARNDGCVEGCDDPSIWNVTLPARPDGDLTGWLWRTVETWTPWGAQKRHHAFTDHDARGRPAQARVVLEGTLPLDRYHSAGLPFAPEPPTRAADTDASGWLIGQTDYDDLGHAVESRGFPSSTEQRRHQVVYDPDYGDLPIAETTFAGLDGSVKLTAEVRSYDRGLGAALEVRDLHGETTRVVQDGFGRLARLYRPQQDPESGCTTGTVPSVEVEYLLTSNATTQPYSLLHTRTQRGATPDASGPDDFQESWAYVDGLGRTLVTLAQADLSAGDEGAWVVQGLTDYDTKGAPARAFRPWFWGEAGADPTKYPLSQSVEAPYGRQRNDAFGRAIQSFGLDGAVIARTATRPLCTDVWDAADIGPGPHQGTYATGCHDGLGRSVRSTERIKVQGKLEERHVLTSYLPSGEVVAITRRRGTDTASNVTRWMRHDSLGRMVLNVEPNTSTNFQPTPVLDGPVPEGMHAWRYVYDYAGELVGTSDARGCGSNYAYDAAGRLVAEDYSPCRPHHVPYSAPNLVTGEGTEVFTTYDTYAPDEQDAIAAVGQGFTGSPALLLGRVASVRDRGSFVLNQVDCRGHVTAVAKQVARPHVLAATGAPSDLFADRYAPRWYVQRARFDGADRTTLATTGSTVTELQGKDVSGETSAVTVSYSRRGLVTQVGGSYGPLITSVTKAADGMTTGVTYGDLAKTQTSYGYDTRRRLRTVQTFRGPPDCWTANPDDPPAHCKSYHPSTDYLSGKPSTFPLLLQDTEVSYDEVDNPIALKDWRLPNEWPAGAKPVSRTMVYDDLYRLTQLDYAYEQGKDAWVSPFAAELETYTFDPRRPQRPFAPQVFASRPLQQTYAYDWLGNTVASDDDAHGFVDRSLGTITNGTATNGPYQLRGASNLTTPSPKESKQGQLEAQYDEAGNLIALQVDRRGSCTTNAACRYRFAYEWDEAGRLVKARRDDTFVSALPPLSEPLASSELGAELRYIYDGSGQRQIKSARDASGREQHTIYTFATLELRGAIWSEEEQDYERNAATEVPLLLAGGVGLGRVHWALGQEPTLEPVFGGAGGSLQVLLTLVDHLGSASVVLDRDTSELAEAITYQGYGSTESDYRPGRWSAFREDHRFTGKEDDSEVGLTYFGVRYLSTSLGRWISADPMSIHSAGADLNAYAYVHGQTLRSTDPVGLCGTNGAGGCASTETPEMAEAAANEAKADRPWAPTIDNVAAAQSEKEREAPDFATQVVGGAGIGASRALETTVKAVSHPVETAKATASSIVRGDTFPPVMLWSLGRAAFAKGQELAEATKEGLLVEKLSEIAGEQMVYGAMGEVGGVALEAIFKGLSWAPAVSQVATRNRTLSTVAMAEDLDVQVSAQMLADARGESTWFLHPDLAGVASTERLTLVAHGSPHELAGMRASQVAKVLRDNGIQPPFIELSSCWTGSGCFARELANEMGVPVRAPIGPVTVIDGIPGVPQVQFHPAPPMAPNAGWRTFLPVIQ